MSKLNTGRIAIKVVVGVAVGTTVSIAIGTILNSPDIAVKGVTKTMTKIGGSLIGAYVGTQVADHVDENIQRSILVGKTVYENMKLRKELEELKKQNEQLATT